MASLYWISCLSFLHPCSHYNDILMSAMASQITSLEIVYSIIYSGADQRIHQSSASLAFVRGIHRWPVNSPHKGPAMWKMTSSWYLWRLMWSVKSAWNDSYRHHITYSIWEFYVTYLTYLWALTVFTPLIWNSTLCWVMTWPIQELSGFTNSIFWHTIPATLFLFIWLFSTLWTWDKSGVCKTCLTEWICITSTNVMAHLSW